MGAIIKFLNLCISAGEGSMFFNLLLQTDLCQLDLSKYNYASKLDDSNLMEFWCIVFFARLFSLIQLAIATELNGVTELTGSRKE